MGGSLEMSDKRKYTKTPADVRREFGEAQNREDLRAGEPPNGGGASVKQHERVTAAAAHRPVPDLGAPLFRNTKKDDSVP